MNQWLHRYSLLVVSATLLLIFAGGLVTSHEAGLAVPDWPLSYGQFFPPMVGNIFWEHGHRMIAGTVGILTFILTLWIQNHEKRKKIKILTWIAFSSVIAQAVLGGLTVIYMLPPAISILHACLAQTFFCMLIAISYFLSTFHENQMCKPTQGDPVARQKIKKLLALTLMFIYIQLILGAVIRHTGMGILFHVVVAFLVAVHIFLVSSKITSLYSLTHPTVHFSRGLGLLVLAQLILGVGSLIHTQMLHRGYSPTTSEVLFTASHQTVGAMILGICFLVTLMVYDGLRD